MNMATVFVADFKKLDVSDYPSIHKYTGVEDRSLWVLLVAKEKLGIPDLSPYEIQRTLTEVFEVSVTVPGVRYALNKAKGKVHRVRSKKGDRYAIMQKGRDALLCQLSVLVVEPEKAYKAIRSFQMLLAALTGHIRICDPYIDTKTLDMLSLIPKKCRIKLLTCNIQKPKILRRDYTVYQAQYKNLEIKVLSSGNLHDRYIIDENAMWLLGQSLNGIGKKETFVVRLGEDIKSRSMELFKENWGRGVCL
jgi:hypothetical protein